MFELLKRWKRGRKIILPYQNCAKQRQAITKTDCTYLKRTIFQLVQDDLWTAGQIIMRKMFIPGSLME